MIADGGLLRTHCPARPQLGLTRAQGGVTRVPAPGASQSEWRDDGGRKASAAAGASREAKGWVKRRARDGDRRVTRVY